MHRRIIENIFEDRLCAWCFAGYHIERIQEFWFPGHGHPIHIMMRPGCSNLTCLRDSKKSALEKLARQAIGGYGGPDHT